MSDRDKDPAHTISAARELLDNPMLKEAFQRIEQGTIEEMLLPNITDDMRRQKADRVNAIRAVRQQFEDIILVAKTEAQPAIRAP